MRRIQTGILGIDHGDVVMFSDFEHDGEMWRGTGPRQSRKRQSFSQPFTSPPTVQVAITMWDISQNANLRADITAEDVTETGFELVFRTWADTQVARIRATWTAFGPLPNDEDWDLY